MDAEVTSKLIKIAVQLSTKCQFDDIADLDLPVLFGKKRRRVLRGKINSHNDRLRRLAMEIKQIAYTKTTTP